MARRAAVSGRVSVWAGLALGALGAASAFAGEPAPPNDECTGAIPLVLDFPVEGDTTYAKTSLSLADGQLCRNPEPEFSSGQDVFYSFTPDTTGYYDFGTCGSMFDTVLSVHSGCPATAANTIVCNDIAPQTLCVGDGQSSYLTSVQLTAGTTYYIRVAGRAYGDFSFSGAFTLFAFAQDTPTLPPTNDLCSNAQALTAGTTIEGSTIYATGEGSCGDLGLDAWDVWYSFTSTAGSVQTYRFTVLPPMFNGRAVTMSLYNTCGSDPILCQSFPNDFDTVGTALTVNLNPGQSVRLRIAGQYGAQDTFDLRTENLGTPLPNGSCATATMLTLDTPVAVDTTKAPSAAPTSCGNRDFNPLWYTFTAPAEGFYYFETSNHSQSNPETQTILELYSSCGGEPIVCAFNGGPGYFTATSAQHMEANETIKIRASIHILPGIGIGFGNAGNPGGTSLRGPADQFTLEVSGLPDPPAVTNDTCPTAKAITLTPNVEYTDSVDITVATDDPDICFAPGENEAAPSGIWYTFTPSVSGAVQVSMRTDAFYPTRMTFYTGSCGSLTQPVCAGFNNLRNVTAGTTYRVLVNPAPSYIKHYGSTVHLSMTLHPAPANDQCSQAIPVGSSTTLNFSTRYADSDPLACLDFGSGNTTLNNTVWYKITTVTAGTLTLHGARTESDFFYRPAGVVFSGTCAARTPVACDGGDSDAFDISTALAAGQTYYIAVGSRFAEYSGPTTMTVNYTGTVGGVCRADFNNVNGVTVQDIFDFLTAWLAGNSTADFNGVNGVTVQDIFDFLTAWLAGC